MSATAWERKIGLADHDGTTVEVRWVPADEEGDGLVGIYLQTGAATLNAHAEPIALRQLAAALLDGADALEAERQGGSPS